MEPRAELPVTLAALPKVPRLPLLLPLARAREIRVPRPGWWGGSSRSRWLLLLRLPRAARVCRCMCTQVRWVVVVLRPLVTLAVSALLPPLHRREHAQHNEGGWE